MKKIVLIFSIFILSQTLHAQFRYGVTGGLNISGGILPDLSLNRDINSLLNGEDVVQGTPQLADFKLLYKAGVFVRYDGKIGNAKIAVNYTATDIKKDLDLNAFNASILELKMNYIDIDLSYNLNVFPYVYWTFGYSPSFLISDDDTKANIATFDSRIFTGFGIKIGNGTSIDVNVVVGLNEVIEGSYIHQLMVPVTVSIPLN